MRLYKQKNVPIQHRNALDSPPTTTSPHRLKRATEVVSKQISGHNAMLAQFKELKLPRPPVLSAKPALAPQTDCPETLPPKQSKVAKVSGKPPIVPERSPISKAPTSAASLKQHVSFSGASMKSRSPTKPPGLGVEKAPPPVKKASPPRAALSRAQSVTSPNRPTLQKARAKPTTSPAKCYPTVIPSSKQVDFNESILTVPWFQSLVEDPTLEADLTLKADFTADLECQVTQIFSVGLGSTSEDEVVRRGEMAPPKALPEATLAPTLEPMSAIVELWEPEIDTAVESEAAMNSKSAARADGFETIPLDQNQTAYVAATQAQVGDTHGVASIPIAWRSHTLSRLAAAVVGSKVRLPRILPHHPPSSTDYEYVAYLGKGAFGAVALGIHKQSQRQCAVKIICKAIVEEQNIIHDVLAEQRIMREASGHPFLLGLLASFHNAYAFYLVSEYCCSTLFDERHHMPESDKKLASAELACAVDHLHSLGIIHRDIKLENVMMKNDGHVVLGDFGLAHRLEAPRSHALRLSASVRTGGSNTLKPVTRGVCGTLPYMAPEILCNMDYSYGVDWFAYGVFLHVFYLNRFPWLGEHEYPASYLRGMMSTISIGLAFQNGSFGALLNKLFCTDQDARADFSVIRRAAFFANTDWQNVIVGGLSSSYLPQGRGHRVRPMGVDEIPPWIEHVPQSSVYSDPYPNFTWLNPSTIVGDITPDLCDADSSVDSSAIVPYTHSHFETSSERSPVQYENLQVIDIPPLSSLFRQSFSDSVPESHVSNVLRDSVRPLDEGETPIFADFTFPPEWFAAFGDSGICFGQGAATTPTPEDDEALVRMTIRSLDVGEEPVFELPSGWKDASTSSPSDVTPPASSRPAATRKTSVLPRLKSLWKRAASKFMPRRV